VDSQTKQPLRVNAPQSNLQNPIAVYSTSPTDSDATKKQEAASRLLKSSIQHGLLKMLQLRTVASDPTRTVPQAHGNAEEEFKKIEEGILQAVDDYLLIL